MSELKLAPSLMCANWVNISEEIDKLTNAGINMFHIDIMDGYYVPNQALSLNDVKTLRKYTNKTLDVHLMVERPEEIIDHFIKEKVDIIYFHIETVKHSIRFIKNIQHNGIKAGVVLNPHQPLYMIKEILPIIDYVLLMTVDPGFAGQKFITETECKIEQLVEQKKKYGFEITVDGAISKQKIIELRKKGVDIFVVGTSLLFNKNKDYKTIIDNLKEEISNEIK